MNKQNKLIVSYQECKTPEQANNKKEMLNNAVNKRMRKKEKENKNVAKKEHLGGKRIDSAA